MLHKNQGVRKEASHTDNIEGDVMLASSGNQQSRSLWPFVIGPGKNRTLGNKDTASNYQAVVTDKSLAPSL